MAGDQPVGGGGSSTNGASYTGAAWVRTDFGMPSGNLAADGVSRPVAINSASVSGTKSSATSAGFDGNLYLFNNTGGTMSFSRYIGNGYTCNDGSYTWTGGGLQGSYNWSTCPAQASAPGRTASATISGRVDLTWTAPDNGNRTITGYTIYNGTTAVKTVGSVLSSFVDGLTPGTAYTFRVAATNNLGTAQYSAASTSVTALGVPSAPQTLAGTTATTGATLGRVNLTWSAPAVSGGGGTVTYRVYYTPSGGTRTLAPTSGGGVVATITGTGAIISGLTPGTSYTFDVTGNNTYGEGAASNTTVEIASYAPSQVRTPTATATSNPGEVYLTWVIPSDTAGGIANYYIYESTAPTTVFATVSGTTLNYTATGLTPGGYYGFFIRAANAAANAASSYGTASTTVYAMTLGVPTQVSGLAVSAVNQVAGALKLDWVPANGSIMTRIYYDTTPPTPIASVNSTSYTIYGLTPGQAYSFAVTAVNTYAEGPAAYSSGTPISTTVQSVGSVAIPNQTNSTIYNGLEYSVSATPTATTFTYTKVASGTYPLATVPASTAAISNKTNDNISATNVTISAPGGPTSSEFSYTRSITGTLGDIPANTETSTTVTNATNALFNGSKTVSAVDIGAGWIEYSAGGAASVTSAVATGTVANLSNTAYNGTYVIGGVTETEFTYLSAADPAPADQETTSAFGQVTNLTNTHLYNEDPVTVVAVPSHNTLTYTTTPVATSLASYPYVFSTTTTDSDPGSGNIRFSTGTASTVSFLYIDNLDSNAVSRTGWYATWDDLGTVARGRIVVTQGANTWQYVLNAGVTAASGYYKIPVTYASGTGLPTNSTAVTVSFIPAQTADVDVPYGEVRKADSVAKLDVRYRSGWLG